MNYWPLLGLLWIVAGFALRINPLAVVSSAAMYIGIAAGFSWLEVLTFIGEAFARNRYLLLFALVFPLIAVSERGGLRERVREAALRHKTASVMRIIMAYFFFRQLTASLGLTSLAGQAQTVRPLLAPMAEAALLRQKGTYSQAITEKLRAFCGATDNVALFFGEDIFIAFAAVLLMQGFLAEQGYVLEPLTIAMWGIPSAICAALIHGWRISRWQSHAS